MARTSGVSTGPGATALTRMPCGASSTAITLVMTMTPPFDAPYAVRPVLPVIPETDAMIDDSALTRAAASPSRLRATQETADQIDVENAAEQFGAGLERRDVVRDAGRIDQAGERTDGAFACRDGLLPPHLRRTRRDESNHGSKRCECRAGGVEIARLDVDDADPPVGFEDRLRDRHADARTAAGYKNVKWTALMSVLAPSFDRH